MIIDQEKSIYSYIYIFSISAVLKVETDIITCTTECPIQIAVILGIMFVETFKTDVFCFYL